VGTEPVDYCREIETYLCRKNDGHLIRVVGPSFERVAGWEKQGIPLKVAFAGIDRYFARYYRQGARRRPVRIDFCEADVLDVFDEWRRAVGVTQSSVGSRQASVGHRSPVASRESLPAHLERVVTKLSSLRASGALGDDCDPILDAVGRELDAARAARGGLRGDARQAALDRLSSLDAQLLAVARARLDEPTRIALAREAEAELATFRSGMAADAYARARDAAIDRLVRERFGLPVVGFNG
jgi:hypothetical protein